MCTHKFMFPEDKPENYNPDGKTLKGKCKCGATQDAYGRRWMIPRLEHFHQFPCCAPNSIDKHRGIW